MSVNSNYCNLLEVIGQYSFFFPSTLPKLSFTDAESESQKVAADRENIPNLKAYFNSLSVMITNYFKIAFRNVLKSKTFSAINMLGISFGMAASILILYYVLYETSFDKFHKNADQVYRVEVGTYRGGNLESESALTSPAVGKSLIDNFPDVEGFTRIASNAGKTIIISNDKSFREDKAYIVDASLLKVLDIELAQGDQDNVLSEALNVAISETLAEKIFGSEWMTQSILHKTIDLRSDGLTGTFQISGIFKNLPSYSHFRPEILASKNYLTALVGDVANDDSWNFNFFYTYVKLAPWANPQELSAKFNAYVGNSQKEMLASENITLDFRLRPLTDIHLKSQIQFELESNGDSKTVYVLGVIGIIILVVAWINFINLATARSIRRAKEVGVRKVLGASKAQLVGQFTAEAALMNAMSFTAALGVIQLSKAGFSELSGVPLDFITWSVLSSNTEITFAVIIVLACGTILSGVYPAFVLSGFNPISALKAKVINPRGINLRKTLVTAQFAIALVMISATFIVFKQVNFMRATDLGVDIERTIVIEAAENFDQIVDGAKKGFKQSVKNLPFVNGVTMSSVVPGHEISFRSYNLTDAKEGKQINCGLAGVDADFFNDFKIDLIAGRIFSSSDFDKDKVLMNEEAARQLGYASPGEALGRKVIHNGKREEEFEVVGVVKNHHQRSLKNVVEPIMFLNGRDLHFYSVKLESQGWNEIQNSVEILSLQFQSYFPRNPFNYHFLDQQFDNQYKTEIKFSQVFLVFSIMAIVISSLGLIGMSTFMINLRNKEIGIRKVYGASNRSVTLLLIKDYVNLLVIAVTVGMPVVWYLSTQWLMDYPYRIDLNVLTLSVPIFILTIVMILSTGVQSLRAASGNPIDTIKNE